jgi:diguanylate cyclase (GGDEF)-like protein
MKIPEPTTGMLIGGVMASEARDSSNESIDIAGMDISVIESNRATVNYEHRQSSDANGQEIVGKIVYAKKIFKESDCETEYQKEAFKQLRGIPFLYGIIRLFDGAGHEAAQHLAAQIRDYTKNGEPSIMGFSVEGATLKRDGSKILKTIARKVALTNTPCNKTCTIKLLADPNAPEGFEKFGDNLTKSLEYSEPEIQLIAATAILSALAKATTAGSYDAAPSSLSGGQALQVEDRSLKNQALAAIRDFDRSWDKKKFREFAKSRLPDVSEQFLDHFSDLAEDLRLKKSAIEQKDLAIDTIVNSLQNLEIELRKSVTEATTPFVQYPEVHKVSAFINGAVRPVGRFMIHNGQLHHLEDYHSFLTNLLPEGPLTSAVQNTLVALTTPLLTTTQHKFESPGSGGQVSAVPDPLPKPQVFEYQRAGMFEPHVIEFCGDKVSLDGAQLAPNEVELILGNVSRGVASLRYKMGDTLQKNEMDPDDALQHVRAAVAAGHIHPDVADALTRHIHVDPMTNLGNKYAWTKFSEKNRPGVYIAIDSNGLKHVNDTLGHAVGDAAIKSQASALRAAGEKTGAKIWRVGGDEAVAYLPTHEGALQFLHHAREAMGQAPPINGTHQLSASFGLGLSPEHADQAMYLAKEKKKDKLTGNNIYHPSKTPNFAHSLVPGSEGPIHMGSSSLPPIKEDKPGKLPQSSSEAQI